MKLLFIFGTRPEAIKMAPLILKAKERNFFDVRVCVTGQHSEMLYQVLDFFDIKPDHDINVMTHDQSLFDISADILKSLKSILTGEKPDMVLVQGDTTTAFIGALAGYYLKIPVAHIEAGLRSHNKFSPFPEETNRVLVGHVADYHFAPTQRARENLIAEGINEDNIYLSGNTVIDALFLTINVIRKQEHIYSKYFHWLNPEKNLILVTGHRRESFGGPFQNICLALKDIAKDNNVEIVYPVHLNPNVRKPVFDMLDGLHNIHLMEPLSYPYLVWLMEKSYLILTDSGGIQEEAPGLGKPVLVMRDVTERVEGIEAGTCRLVGSDRETIVQETMKLLNDRDLYRMMSSAVNPYGDGTSSVKILDIMRKKGQR